jgi:CheY-like chemotaxis protein
VNSSPRVLVIDGSSDTETVLKAVLEPRGTSVGRRRNHRLASRLDASSAPEVVVIDLDAEPDALRTASPWQDSPRVLLGSLRPATTARSERFLSKPFQYPELVRLIEELLDENAAA